MQKVEEMSHGDVTLGPGTLYGALSKLEKDKLIKKTDEETIEESVTFLLTLEKKL